MKDYIKYAMEFYPNMFQHPSQVLEHLFCTLGNGIHLNQKMKLNENYSCEEVYPFPAPTPLKHIYPWSQNEKFQPFRKYIGCQDVGFKESVEYFLACLKLTPRKIAGEWLDNIELISEVLSKEIDLPHYDKDDVEGFIKSLGSYKKSIDNIQDGTKVKSRDSVRKVWFFDAQWSDLPEEIEEEVRHLWTNYELGNDNYIVKRKLDEDLFEDYPKIYLWCKYKGVQEGEQVIIHWWW